MSSSSLRRAESRIALTDLLAKGSNLLVSDKWNANLLVRNKWTPLHAQIVGTIDGGVFHCPSDEQGVAFSDDPNDPTDAGWGQTVALNQSVPCVVFASVEVRAFDVSRRRMQDLALTIEFRDTADKIINKSVTYISPRRNDWHKVSVRVVPPSATATATFKLVALTMAGRSEFRNPMFARLPADGSLISIDGFALPAGVQPAQGWWVVDMHAPKALVPLAQAEELGLQSVITDKSATESTFSATVKDTTGRDRALTLLYVLPVDGESWRWLSDLKTESDTASPGEYLVASATQGGRGQLSRWPFAAVANGSTGRSIAIDLNRPAVYRVGYSAGARVLYLAIDLGLAPEHPSAELAGGVFEFDGRWGFSGAIDAYYAKFPENFHNRTPKQGQWMPFSSIASIPDWQDFDFRFLEGGGEMEFCEANGIYSLDYQEPLTYWMRMPADVPRSMDTGIANIKALVEKGDRHAKAFLTSAYHDSEGRWAGTGVAAAWCDGIVWSMNSAPGIAGENHFSMQWNDAIRERTITMKLHGLYIDSIEGYITDELNYRREHFGAIDTPLTFDILNRPVIYTGLVVFEYTRAMADAYHALGKITMANTTPGRFPWLPPLLDVMGTETDWNSGDKWTPPPDDYLLFVRAMVGPKPFCFLMNTNFKLWSYHHSELYMKRCVAYGMYPGFFSANAMTDAYFSNPDLYERDRPLFKRYVPLCRIAGEAGWRPITRARSNDAKVYVQRFGDNILTVFNDTGEMREVTITLDGEWPASCVDRVSSNAVAVSGDKATLTLGHEDVAVLIFGKA